VFLDDEASASGDDDDGEDPGDLDRDLSGFIVGSEEQGTSGRLDASQPTG
jgi:hypothetical protein